MNLSAALVNRGVVMTISVHDCPGLPVTSAPVNVEAAMTFSPELSISAR
ncbi:MAG TPA: hypothetical protein PLA17_04565 [Bacteroidales bacterium]|jgi:hypothetical protein|nr:hypothetical protein [Bacteroidales bacterium]